MAIKRNKKGQFVKGTTIPASWRKGKSKNKKK